VLIQGIGETVAGTAVGIVANRTPRNLVGAGIPQGCVAVKGFEDIGGFFELQPQHIGIHFIQKRVQRVVHMLEGFVEDLV